MPIAKDPNKSEFYVYRLIADGIPFYVGIGRSTRASDRVRYVRYLIARESEGKLVNWSFSTRVIAALLLAKCDIDVVYSATGLTRNQALTRERTEIRRLIEDGVALANIHHNPQRFGSHESAIASVLEECGKIAPNKRLQTDAQQTSRR